MEETMLLCRQCRHVFRILASDSCDINKRTACPRCGSFDLSEAPVWAPLGSGANIFNSSEWEYECQECHHKFQMPIPKSPSEEKERKCPACGHGHIHRLDAVGGEPLYCG